MCRQAAQSYLFLGFLSILASLGGALHGRNALLDPLAPGQDALVPGRREEERASEARGERGSAKLLQATLDPRP